MSHIRITQERSKIRCLDKHKRTLAALGLRRVNHSVVHTDTPQIRGMVAQVSYLLRVEPVEVGATEPGATPARAVARPARKRSAAKRPTKKRAAAKRPVAKKPVSRARRSKTTGAKKKGAR